ncbi:hypothetical protein OIU85_018995 [Salix viminalis]|uniref:Uncharacterized protein n=1 Tax=Salix viminalis TaxID=40686 RepID=A0A9Q0UUW6_SALVM|nr:hypothetical protein OIU85_018995 [Salix viminalis]
MASRRRREGRREKRGDLCRREREAEGRRVCRANEKRRQKGEGCGWEKGVACEKKIRRPEKGLWVQKKIRFCADFWVKKIRFLQICEKKINRPEKGLGCREDKEGAWVQKKIRFCADFWVKKIRFLQICEKKINQPEKGLGCREDKEGAWVQKKIRFARRRQIGQRRGLGAEKIRKGLGCRRR